jgi:RHS repeat-associated protein
LSDWEFRDGVSILRNNLTWDAASRLTTLADPANAALQGAYQYDVLDRLTVAQQGNPVTDTQQFGYDAVGNRSNVTVDGALTNLTYGSTTNQLLQLTGALGPDPLHGDSTRSYSYNLANRLVQVSNAGGTLGSYQVTALGQRVAKTVGGLTTLFAYDEQGHLLGEYDGSGKLIEETVWLEDLPVATLRPTPGSMTTPIQVDVYYVHADHLGTPRAVTRPSDNTLLWRWDNLDPFGANAANENPAGAGTFTYGLRFPGQYYDAETGTNYNYFRDYDPTVGRYIESDPIGLDGGLNTYAYATDNPLLAIDPKGLAIWICSRSAKGMPGNHTYIWDDRGSGRSCGMEQFFGHGDDPFKPERGPNGGDSCRKVPGSDGVEDNVMNCCRDSNKSGGWVPFINDCLTVANRCIDRFLPGANPGAPGNRFGKCQSCATK